MHFWNCKKGPKIAPKLRCRWDFHFPGVSSRDANNSCFPWFFTRLCSAEPCLCGGVGHGAGRWENSETSTVKRQDFGVWGGPGFSWSKLICTNTFWPYELDSSWIQGSCFFHPHPSFEGWESDLFFRSGLALGQYNWSLLWCICVDFAGIMANVSEFERVLKEQAPYL